jgi:hypothetical protein
VDLAQPRPRRIDYRPPALAELGDRTGDRQIAVGAAGESMVRPRRDGP